jgi:hypothetical protein
LEEFSKRQSNKLLGVVRVDISFIGVHNYPDFCSLDLSYLYWVEVSRGERKPLQAEKGYLVKLKYSTSRKFFSPLEISILL